MRKKGPESFVTRTPGISRSRASLVVTIEEKDLVLAQAELTTISQTGDYTELCNAVIPHRMVD